MIKDTLDIAGFTIIKRLGTGARSVIYLARDEQTKEKVALKRVVYEQPEDSRVFEQMQTEYKIARQVDHPYMRKCHKLIKKRNLFKVKELLLSMEMFDGQSLENSPTLSLVDVLLIFRMVATGLNAMHQTGLIHCDIKPNNILISEQCTIKIIDLGQSCRIGTTKPRIQGTPDYIAPEQVRRKPLDQKTDVFNLGATIYWALTGKNVPTLIPPKSDRVAIAAEKSFPAPHEIYRKIPLGISKFVMDCVSDNPDRRPPNMAVVISKLDLQIHNIFGNRLNKNAADDN